MSTALEYLAAAVFGNLLPRHPTGRHSKRYASMDDWRKAERTSGSAFYAPKHRAIA